MLAKNKFDSQHEKRAISGRCAMFVDFYVGFLLKWQKARKEENIYLFMLVVRGLILHKDKLAALDVLLGRLRLPVWVSERASLIEKPFILS